MRLVREGVCDGPSIAKISGYRLPDVEFLREHGYVKVLLINDADGINLAAIASLSGLKRLSISENNTPITLGSFPQLEEFSCEWHKAINLMEAPQSVCRLSLRKYQPPKKNLSQLPGLTGLDALALTQGNLTSLEGLCKFPSLTSLDMAYMRSLSDIGALSECGSRLEALLLMNCPRIEYDLLSTLTSLKKLHIHSCAPLASVQFLKYLDQLEEFRFVDTDVLDGDLTPLLQLDRLKAVGFIDKRHFSHKYVEIEAILKSREAKN